MPAAFTTYGGWGEVMLNKLELEYEARKKQEKADGGSGWATVRWKQNLLEKMSVAIAKGTPHFPQTGQLPAHRKGSSCELPGNSRG